MYILITGCAGFIGFHLAKTLAKQGFRIYGIDSVNNYYDVSLKDTRLKECGIEHYEYGKETISILFPNFIFRQTNLCDNEQMDEIFQQNHFDCIVNLAAQAGVRYSLTNPKAYLDSNIAGFMNLLEYCNRYTCSKLIYASSSSVYGNSTSMPFKEADRTDNPVSIYAASKKSNELMAFSYSHLYKIQTIGLRFFTVYGPYGRPDMAPMLFANAIKEDKPIRIFNNGDLSRDFTYIDDIVEGITDIIKQENIVREDQVGVPAVIYNIGHGTPMKLMDFISILENNFGKKAKKEFIGMQPGDVYQTWADTSKLQKDYHYTPKTSLEEGISHFSRWFEEFYQSKK